MEGTGARIAVWTQKRRISSWWSCLERGWGKGTAAAAWEVEQRLGPLKGPYASHRY
jgi:hypothetical protein